MKGMIVLAAATLAAACGGMSSERDDRADAGDAAPPTGFPQVSENTCQGEACMPSYEAVPCREIPLVSGPRQANVVATLRRTDTVVVRTDLHLMRPGHVVMQRDVSVPDDWNSGSRPATALRFSKGDTLQLLKYIGEGFWLGSYEGRTMEVAEFWGGPDAPSSAEDSARSRDALGTWPVIETWLRISRGGQVIGWWQDTSGVRTLRPIGEYGERLGLGC